MGMAKRQSLLLPIFFVSSFLIQNCVYVNCIGVNYGTLGNNLPPPAQVAKFLSEQTVIDRVKIFDVNPDIIRAFAGTGILLTVTVPNGEIPNLVNLQYARQWVVNNIKPFHPATKINYISVGTEVLHWGPQNLRDNLVAAMKSMYQALGLEGISDIKVSSPHSLGILEVSEPPSMGKFRPGWDVGILAPMLKFLRESKSPFMVNTYSYFGFDPQNLNFSILQQPNHGYYDKISRRHYSDRWDLLMDAVFMAMKRLGYADVEIVVTETGWPSAGDIPQCNPANAAAYNGGLMKKYRSGSGTPLMPHKKFETYIFALFNENQKPGPLAEQNWGLFRPDLTPVYDVNILKSQTPGGRNRKKKGNPSTTIAVPQQGKKWCVPKGGVSDGALGSNIKYVCAQSGIDCTPIQQGHPCFDPNTPRNHATYAMNLWYQTKGHSNFNCDFSGTGVVTSVDPSYGQCRFLA